MSASQPFNAEQQSVIDTIAGFGWMVIGVSPRIDSDDPKQWFAYTVGLPQAFGWPEIICFNLDQEVMRLLLNNTVAECHRRSLQPSSGLLLQHVANAAEMKLSTIPDADWKPRTLWSFWYADNVRPAPPGGIRCLQLLWPDKAGRFPGDPLCDPAVVSDQEPLVLPQRVRGEVRW